LISFPFSLFQGFCNDSHPFLTEPRLILNQRSFHPNHPNHPQKCHNFDTFLLKKVEKS